MQLRRADFLSSASTRYHGAYDVSVYFSILSFAFEYSTQRSRDSTSIGESFQRLIGFSMRSRKRRSCSSSLTENQYLISLIPERTSISSKRGQARRNSLYSSSVQKPITCSTPARLYQLRSNSTISPQFGKCGTRSAENTTGCARARSARAGRSRDRRAG